MAWQARRPKAYMPDAVHDSTAKRWRGYQRLLGWGQGILCRLLAQHHSRSLYHFVLHMPGEFDFYLEGPSLARQAIAELLPEAPLYANLALSRCQRTHVHGLAMLTDYEHQRLQATRAVTSCRAIRTDKDMKDVGLYFSRPNDESACKSRPKDLALYSVEELAEQAREAAERWLEARNTCNTARLPRRSWTRNLPFLKPDPEHVRPPAPVRPSQRRAVPVRPARSMIWLVERASQAAPAGTGNRATVSQWSLICIFLEWFLRSGGPRGPPRAAECVVHHRDLHSRKFHACPLPNHPALTRLYRSTSPHQYLPFFTLFTSTPRCLAKAS
ncbi:hypothetical protein GCM10008955_26390 [Deinococcus malanensis]|uniref:Uncharacterized protein n=1 Tax=Deinococcus malanensis TaxID=1706855 RepID=A0ABQ2EXK7_9DEIO|nr:hypothetical protein GCM10008955_26390 [Deinococcus malanensis]